MGQVEFTVTWNLTQLEKSSLKSGRFSSLESSLKLNLWASEFVRWTLGLIRWAYSSLINSKSYLQPFVLVKWLPTTGPTPLLTQSTIHSIPLSSIKDSSVFTLFLTHLLSSSFFLFSFFWKAHPLTLTDNTNNPRNTESKIKTTLSYFLTCSVSLRTRV